jgi:hypothetical protein
MVASHLPDLALRPSPPRKNALDDSPLESTAVHALKMVNHAEWNRKKQRKVSKLEEDWTLCAAQIYLEGQGSSSGLCCAVSCHSGAWFHRKYEFQTCSLCLVWIWITILQLITVPKARTKIFHFWLFLIPSKELLISLSVLHGFTRNIARTFRLIEAQLVIEPNPQ